MSNSPRTTLPDPSGSREPARAYSVTRARGDPSEVRAHRIFEPELERIRDQRVADRHLVDAGGDRAELAHVGEAQVVPGVHAEAERTRFLGSRGETREHRARTRTA